MAKQLELLSLTALDNGHFQATGTVDGKSFFARTKLWKGEPIFKIQEDPGNGDELAHIRMAKSRFDRGTRISVARFLKAARVEFFRAKPELDGLTLKELRAKAKELGVTGTHRKGITKAEVLDLVRAAA
jgi:hypothetical protein